MPTYTREILLLSSVTYLPINVNFQMQAAVYISVTLNTEGNYCVHSAQRSCTH